MTVGTWNMLPDTGGHYVSHHHPGGVPVWVARLDVQSPFSFRSELDGG